MIKVADARTGKVKRYETDTGEQVAVRKGDRLVLTSYGKRHGYVVRGLKVYEAGAKYPGY
jgi:hypothetical protein